MERGHHKKRLKIEPNVCSLKAFLKTQRDTEYYITRKKKGKLSGHLKKWAAFNI